MAAVPMCPGCRALLAPDEESCPYCGWNVRVTEIRREGTALARFLRPLGGIVPVLLGANAALFLATILVQGALARGGVDGFVDAAMNPRGKILALLGANLPEQVLRGEWWRLLAPVFLHGGLLHIAVNMMSLNSIGRPVEEAYGAGKALALYLLAGLAGSAASILWFSFHGGHPGIPRIGASGAIIGYAGLIAALGFRIGGEAGRALWKPMIQSVGFILALGLILAFYGGPVSFDNSAHVGGFAFGFAAGWICTFGARARSNPAAVRAWDTAAVVLSVLTLASFVPPALMLAEVLRRG